MSKINKIRIVNLNYNYNTMKIDDEKFYLDGESTMFNLRNGGGKSVLVQMLMAPFVNKRYRNAKERTFESYFTTSMPTHILVEWKLDDGAGYLLTGMMVRKKDVASDESSKERLDIINYVHEYKGKNENDIDNIPIIEEMENKRNLKSFVSCKGFFENLKKDRSLKFYYYDMTNAVTTKQYFNKLEEYKINYREWETIMKQINIKESGLSELFTKAKDSSGLVKEWFLPAVENKLKNDEDRIDNYRKLLDSYIKQYRQNKANIDKKAKLELFDNLSKEVFKICEEFILTMEKKEETKNYIANVMAYLREKLQEKQNEEEELDRLIENINGQIEELKYEKESIKIYKKQDDINNLSNEAEKQQLLVNESEDRKKGLIRKINILECAKIHRQYQDISKDLQEQEIKLRILSKKNKDNKPRINDLGFTIREILQKELAVVAAEKTEKINLDKSLKDEKDTINKNLKDNRREISRLGENKGKLNAEINAFDQQEKDFNNSFGIALIRNIEGYFDENKILTIDKEIKDEELSLNRERKTTNEKILQNEERLKSKESEKLRNLENLSELKNNLTNKRIEFEALDSEVAKRKEIIKFIDFQESRVFDNEGIIKAFQRKIDLLKDEELKLERSFDNVSKELTKLKTGKILELPKEVEQWLRQKDISITYGMKWLKKNGYSLEKNEDIVKNNPFIPYSLIMDSKEIAIIEKESLDMFTSSPISIINRNDLENTFHSIKEDMVNLKGVSFLICFNNKLLNESELIKLIEDKEAELKDVEDKIKVKKEDIAFYEEKRNQIKYSNLTLEYYQEVERKISQLIEEEQKLRQLEIDLEKTISTIKGEIDELNNKSKHLEKEILKNLDKARAFQSLMESYNRYKNNKASLARVTETLNLLQDQVDKADSRKEEVEKEIIDCNRAIDSYTAKEANISKDLSQYNIYKDGNLIEKDKEDLISEFNALIKDITSSEQELRDKIRVLTQKFKAVENELSVKSDKYELKEEEYINEIYDLQKELDFKDELSKEEAEGNRLKRGYNKVINSLEIAKDNLQKLLSDLKELYNKEEPKLKSLLVEKDFKLEIERLKISIKEANLKKAEVIRIKASVENNLTSLNEFSELDIVNEVSLDINLMELDSVVGKLKRDLNNISSEVFEKEKALRDIVVDLEIRDEFKQESLFKEPIQSLKNLVSKPSEFKEQLNLIIDSYRMIMEKLMADIELIEKEEQKLLESMLEYIRDVHENIGKIDDNSSINIGTRRLKMLNISVPDWEENQGLYSVRLKDYIEQIRNNSLKALELNEDIEDIISNNININKLYDEVVGIGTINIRLYKIEEDKQREISWNEVSRNSGGEGFLSAFVILSSLLSYMRREETDIFSRKEGGKVIIMDNPFAQTSSAHLLKPLMDIAKKSNTQLICFTGLGGDSIYNRFDNIYVLNLIPSKLQNNVKYLRSEHIKGEEEKEQEFLIASRFKIEEEQIKLF